jgi:cytosine/adenosine deaminase-related metal-dependent hydrolase
MGSAAALHMEREIGSLEAGKRADLIVVSTSAPNAMPLYDPCSYLVYSAHAEAVQTVIAEGRILMEKRRILTVDTARIRRQAERFGGQVSRFAASSDRNGKM